MSAFGHVEREAAKDAEIERLRADNERLRAELHSVHAHLQHYREMLAAERAARVAVASPVRQKDEL